MAKMIVSIDGVVIKDVQLTKERTTLGRRPYNDIVIDNLAVSGEHAVFRMLGMDVFIEDLNSTNGSYVNGKAVKRQQLRSGDTIEVGKCQLKFSTQGDTDGLDQPAVFKTGSGVGSVVGQSQATPVAPAAPAPAGARAVPTHAPVSDAAIRVLSGAAVGREVALVKVVTTIGKPGVAVAAITKRPHGFVLAHVEGDSMPLVNGAPIGDEAVQLRNGDMLELAGTRMQFTHI